MPSRRVVVADNDPDVVALLVFDLEHEGHEVVATASTGDEAVAACRTMHPDVLVVDLRMPPGPDGLEAAATVRRDDPAIEILLFTNYRDLALARRAATIGVRVLRKGNLRALRRELAKA